jgi:hypothetical protein
MKTYRGSRGIAPLILNLNEFNPSTGEGTVELRIIRLSVLFEEINLSLRNPSSTGEPPLQDT